MRSIIVTTIAALSLLAACGPREAKEENAAVPAETTATAPAGFDHDPAFDAAGYYRPVTNIVIGTAQLDHIAVGAASDFGAWEKGEREGVFGPIWLEFVDTTSPRTFNELGAEVHTVRMRVMPTAYKLNSTDIAFAGSDPKLGKVVFQGQFDAPSYSEAKKSGSSGNLPVMIGALTLGENTLRNQRFTYWAGD